MSNANQPYAILVGVGTLYLAPVGTAMPALTAAPSGAWVSLGETDGGVKVTKTRNREKFSSDQRTGTVKAVQTEEGLTVEVNAHENTLENLANAIGGTVAVTAAGSGTIGKKLLKLHGGATVGEFALVFRGNSPYGNWPGQFCLPRGYMDDDVESEFVKDGKTLIPIKFEALEDLNAATEDDRFGYAEYQHAAAL